MNVYYQEALLDWRTSFELDSPAMVDDEEAENLVLALSTRLRSVSES